MAVSFVSVGSPVQSLSNSPGVAAPSGTAAGDLDVLFGTVKPDTATATPTAGQGWIVQIDAVVGTGAQGVDTGAQRVYMWTRELTAAAGTIDVNLSGQNTSVHVRHAYRKPTDKVWDVAVGGAGSDTTSATSFAATAPTAVPITADDLLALLASTAGDVSHSGQAVTASGATITATERSDTPSTTGNDIGLMTLTATLTGSSTAAMGLTSTLSGAQTGGAAFLRVRDATSATVVTGSGDGSA